jgi:two-component system, LytTR family, sensor histidine kinase AlgZ
MCALLADFLRKSLAVGERASIPVEEELALARTYLAVEGRRFGSRLVVEEDVEEGGKSGLLPPLLLQPLIENAVRHGIASRLDGGVVKLEAKTVGSTLRLAVENPVDPDSASRPGHGLGLANVRERLQARYGSEAFLETRRLTDRFRVVLSLPLEVQP